MKNAHILRFILLLCMVAISFSPPLSAQEDSRPSVGLVLSGGGARGIAHIGALKVIEEAGVNVDYIAGTSMGALIGALYAIGYSVESLEEIVDYIDWNEMLTDTISRRSISIEEKDEEARYVTTFPIRDGKIGLPRSLIAGHNIAEMITRLTWPAHNVEDFSKFHIPFACVATDIATGEAVVLDHGYLPDVLRASSAIPSVFSPVKVEGRMLIDGFVANNLPASEVRNMGADIVIGVDVGSGLYNTDDLNSLVRVMEQVINLRGAKNTEKERTLCDILITPELFEYTTTSYWDADSLIVRGERAAREHFDELEHLGAAEGNKKRPLTAPDIIDLEETFTITEIDIEGTSNVSKNMILGKLALSLPANVNFHDLDSAIDRIYGSQYFENATYRLTPSSRGVKLTIRVIEYEDDQFRIGLNYNSDMKSSLLLNTTFRNVMKEGSKLSLSAKLGQNPTYEGLFFTHTGWRPGIGFSINPAFRKFDVRAYSSEGNVEANIKFSIFTTDILFQTIFSNSFALGGGMQYHYSSAKIDIGPANWYDTSLGQMNYLGFMKIDTLDRPVYPQKGFRLYGILRSVTGNLITDPAVDFDSFKQVSVAVAEYIPVFRMLTFFGSFSGGASTNAVIPEYYMFHLGGAEQFPNPFGTTLFPFLGRNLMEVSGPHAIVSRIGLRYEYHRDKFLILRANRGKVSDNFDNLFTKDNLMTGVGLTAGMMSPIGPMEYTLMWESEKKELITHVNIGFTF